MIGPAVYGIVAAAMRYGDPFYDNVSLLLHMNGANLGTIFTDNSKTPKSPSSTLGSPYTITADHQYSTASFYGDGTSATTGRILVYASHVDFAFGTGDFTVEFYFKSYNNSQDQGLFSLGDGGTIFGISCTSGQIRFRHGADVILALTGAVDSAWHHCAFSRVSGVLYGFVDGVLIGSVVNTTNYSQSLFVVGGWSSQASSIYGCNGCIDDVRITKGVGRYTATFNALIEPFPNF